MTISEVVALVEGHEALEGVGIHNDLGKPCLMVKHAPTGQVTQLPVEALEKIDEKTLLAVLLCEREPAVLQHMSRVVGYFSRIQNWNKSKVGELKDRHKGNYAIA